MELNAICLVKNDDDIIEQTLTYATQHCDRIYVIDNGSTDRTWDIVQNCSKSIPQIIPFTQTTELFNAGLRALAYNAVHQELSDADWWLILDSDEFLAEDPRPVINAAMAGGCDIINAWQIQFYFTEHDLAAWQKGQDKRDIPIFERRRYYLIDWQEPRLFRNQSKPIWDVTVNKRVPNGLKGICRRRILNRHYQYRDPIQIENRLKLRSSISSSFSHVTSADWKSTIRDSRKLNYHKEGASWRFSLSGIIHYYSKRVQYPLMRRWRGMKRRLSDAVGVTREDES